MARPNLHGLGIALITPFHADKTIDFDSLARLIEYQIKNGIDYFVVLGTTAETPALTADERREVRDFAQTLGKHRNGLEPAGIQALIKKAAGKRLHFRI